LGDSSATSSLVKWHAWEGTKFVDVSEETKGGWLELRRVGVFETANGKAQPSLLLSAHETDVPAKIIATPNASTSENTTQRWATGGGWWTKLLWLALGVLLIESWLFHRQAVY
jgi:hypothetical protein